MSSGSLPAPRSLVTRVLGALAMGTLVALWTGFLPASVGGDYSYAVVRGDSMRPHLRNGDIVVLRREERYGLGEVVAYRDPQIGAVLHRIVGKQGERFATRGDNREEFDPYAPLPSDVFGREVGAWHGGLPIILGLASPRTTIPFALSVVLLVVSWRSARAAPTRFRRRRPPLRRREVEVA